MDRLVGVFLGIILLLGVIVFDVLLFTDDVLARNLNSYSDTISNSAPGEYSNHTFQFTVLSDIAPGGYIEIDFPNNFSILDPTSTSTWGVRNVELYDDGIARTATTTLSPTTDQVIITAGAGGSIRYNLNTTNGIDSGSVVRLLIGNHTSNAVAGFTTYSSTTGTTTFDGDALPIQNAATSGTKIIGFDVGGDTEEISGEFYITMIEKVGVTGDTTETVPPFRFNPTPTSSLGGTTLNVEIGLETDELAICKWNATSGIPYLTNTQVMDTTGTIVHSTVVAVTAGQVNTFYIRCIDDEGNYNTDDFEITFSVNDQPTGTANEEGSVEGDGTGSGDEGTGSGSGGGGSTGGTEGEANTSGSQSGSGGSGGGSGGDEGEDSDGDVGGGLESSDGAYPSGDAEVRITGYAFPGSTVYALVDGTVTESTTANSSGSYSLVIEEIARGVYTFGVYAIDADSVKSTTFSTSFTVTGGRVSSLSNINVMPSILVSPDPVDPGNTLTISGYSIPDAEITIQNQKENVTASLKTYTTTSNSSGRWTLDVDTAGFSVGTYKVRAKAEQQSGLGLKTDYSDYTFYGVGETANVPLNADLNVDGRVNLTDFSILLFWWGGDGGNSNPPADINQDGSVSLTDFSIMLFQWTG